MKPCACRCLAVVGTDTGVGKTLVAASLSAALRFRGFRVGVFKPAETGCSTGPDGLVPADALILKDASGCLSHLDLINPYRFELPASPAEAANRQNRRISRKQILRCFDLLTSLHDILIMEGAGGLLVPYAPNWLYVDLLAHLDIPLLLVGRSTLGTINHCLLTLRELYRNDLEVRGVVLNRLQRARTPDEEGNPDFIRRFGRVDMLGLFRYLEPPVPTTPEDLAALAEAHMDIDALIESW